MDNECKRLDKSVQKSLGTTGSLLPHLFVFHIFSSVCAVLGTLMHPDILFSQSLRMSSLILVSDY